MRGEHEFPRVGVAAIVTRRDRVLVGRRAGEIGGGTWGLPGGFLELFETWEECARREVREEFGIELRDVRFATATNDVFHEERRHTITIFVRASVAAGEPTVTAPDEVDRWEWHPWPALPEPLFLTLENLLRSGYSIDR